MVARPLLLVAALLLSGTSFAEEPAAAAELAKTPSKTWSKFGWQNLRWGMGPGNVRVLAPLFSAQGLVEQEVASYLDGADYIAHLEEPLFRLPVDARFVFVEDRLREVTVYPGPKGLTQEEWLASCSAWVQHVREGLTSKYGRGACTKEAAGPTCVWEKPGALRVTLAQMTPGCSAYLIYQDGAWLARESRAAAANLKDMQKRESSKL